MRIYFKHYSGAITEYDYLFFDCMAEVNIDEEDEALSEGWLPDDYHCPKHGKKADWYQARQTRINLIQFEDDRRTRKARKKCKEIEVNLGRKKSKKNSPRICDIDIIDYNGMKLNIKSKLNLPHARMHKRNFVLIPLFEIEKKWKHPSKKLDIKTLISSLPMDDITSIKQI